jgi:hypothetical protein
LGLGILDWGLKKPGFLRLRRAVAIWDLGFGIWEWGLGIKETGFFAVNAGCNESIWQKNPVSDLPCVIPN